MEPLTDSPQRMKTIFDATTRREIRTRIEQLQPDSPRLWGKMDPYQMVRHCYLSDEMTHGLKSYKRLFIGRLFGPMTLKQILKNEDPIKKNQPTHPDMKITHQGDFHAEREKWILLMERYAYFDLLESTHPFFGKMTQEQVGQYVYKHTDHHLRQFGK
ncbi:uncharacterized protein DUF1569 [Dyadobacter jejuensis]|uniref:Uncharacterized protein DUF1569 n=1 Tax=Dyadobacter jejuensis TaxID=1082580 RepID=A0A316AKN9_9BACT|nr:DUF1569 domain-containing protein [Dyadobacter jejuensis]PWJ57938.1 uncharacterized protein DUF1569 [Dyadobacter jejuensis]